MQSHLITRKSPTFGFVNVRLVEYGLARLRDEHKGQIVEPLAFLSLMRWFQNQDNAKLETNTRFRLAFEPSRGAAYEELMTLYLIRMLRHPVPFSTIFNFHNTPVWADDMGQIVGCLDGMDVIGDTPENPSLGVVHYATGVEDIIRWIENPDTASAVLISTDLFGPDVMLRCRSAPSNSTVACTKVFLMGQFKSWTDGNKESLDAGTITHALTSLHRDHWFKQTVCHLVLSLSSPH